MTDSTSLDGLEGVQRTSLDSRPRGNDEQERTYQHTHSKGELLMANPFSLEGKVALVTGANTGLGQGIAIALAEAGADIAAAGIAPPIETEAKVRALGRRFVAIEANLSSVEPIDRIVRETI